MPLFFMTLVRCCLETLTESFRKGLRLAAAANETAGAQWTIIGQRIYSRYLRQLHERREREGLPPATDIAPPEYWEQRCQDELSKQLPLPKAA